MIPAQHISGEVARWMKDVPTEDQKSQPPTGFPTLSSARFGSPNPLTSLEVALPGPGLQ